MTHELFHQWTPLAYRVARTVYMRHPGMFTSIKDAQQEAMIGLMIGLRNYRDDHPSHSTRMTYLYTCIYRWLQRTQQKLIHIPMPHLHDALKPPTPKDGEYVKAARRVWTVRQMPIARNREGTKVREYDPEAPEHAPLDCCELYEALGRLTKRERFVLTHRYGLGDETEKTLEEVGKLMGVTRERVRQIEREAKRHLVLLNGKQLRSLVS